MLSRRKTFKHFASDSSFINFIYKLLYYFKVDVSLKKSEFDLSHGFLNVFFGKFALASQLFKNSLQLFGQIFKSHIFSSVNMWITL